jgi:hypothetical protein
MSRVMAINAIIEVAPVLREILDQVDHARREYVRAVGQNGRKSFSQTGRSLAHGDAALEQEATDLIDDCRALPDASAPHPVQGLQIKLLGRLQRHRTHGWTLRRLGDGLGIAVVVLVAFEERLDILGRQQVNVMAESGELTPDVMGSGTGLHPDQTDRQVRQALQQLSTSDLAAQHDAAACIHADQVEDVLAQIDPDGGDALTGAVVGHGTAP